MPFAGLGSRGRISKINEVPTLVHPGLPPLLYLSHVTSLTLHFSHTDFFSSLFNSLEFWCLAFAPAVFSDYMSSFFLFIPLAKHQHHHSKTKPQTDRPKTSALMSSSFKSLLIQQMFVKGCDSEKGNIVLWELCTKWEADPKTFD